MNAVRILVDSVELILVALLVHKNDTAHQRRVLKASRLKLDIHDSPLHSARTLGTDFSENELRAR